jgi:uncharacterized membrane protein
MIGPEMKLFGTYVVRGIMAIIPLWITWLVVAFVFRQLLTIGEPIVSRARQWLSGLSPEVSAQIAWPIVDRALAVFLTIALFLVIGWAVTNVFGRRLVERFEAGLDRIPLVKSVYGGVRKVIAALQTPDGKEGQRVVLINFPSEEMKTVGLVTRTMKEEGTNRVLAVVYVPTTPNPTSGYLEIVPAEHLVATDWTIDEAMNFIITAGAVAPTRPVSYSQPAAAPAPKPNAHEALNTERKASWP